MVKQQKSAEFGNDLGNQVSLLELYAHVIRSVMEDGSRRRKHCCFERTGNVNWFKTSLTALDSGMEETKACLLDKITINIFRGDAFPLKRVCLTNRP
jgi:hypothetical protein